MMARGHGFYADKKDAGDTWGARKGLFCMLLAALREQVVEVCVRLLEEGLVQGTGGNVSARDPQSGLFAISPGGLDYRRTSPGEVAVLDARLVQVDGSRKPSSEAMLHGVFYANRPEVNGVVHVHAPYCTALAVLGQPLPPVSPLVGLSGKGEVPIAPYAPFGSEELARGAYAAAGGCDAVLLANHGAVTVGGDLWRAYALAVQIEHCARVYLIARAAGKPNYLSEEQMCRAIEQFRAYGK